MTDILEGIPEDSVSVGQLTDIDLSGIPDDSGGASGSGQRHGIDLSGIPDVSPVKEQALEAIKLTEDFDQAREAEAQALAEKHGLSLPLVREELDRVKKMDSYQAAEAMLGESDALSIFMSDPERAALGINDMPKLSGAEKIWNSIKSSQTGRLTGENFNRYSTIVDNSSFLLDVAGDLAAGRPARDQARLDAILSDRGPKNEDTNILQDLAIATGGQLPIVGEVLKERVVKGQTLGMATGTAAAVTPGAQITVPAAYAGGVVVGGTSAAIETAYRVEAAAALPELLNITDVNGQKIDPQIAGVGAIAIGAINAGLETVGGNALLNAIPGGRALMTGTLTRAVKSALQDQATVSALATALKVGGKAVALEGGTEGAQEVINILAEHVAKRFSDGADGTFFTSFDLGGAVKRVWESAYQGGLAGLGFSAPHITAQATSTAMNTIAAGDLRERVVATGEALNDSTLKAAAPERMKEFLNIAGMGEEVYLDGAALYQMGPEAAGALAGKLGVDSERMQEAVVAGQDIRISTADIYANFTTEEIAAIAEDLKPAPGAMTSRAAKAQDIPEIINRLSGLADDSMDFQRAKGELRDQFKQAFVDRGFDPRAGADQYAGHVADLWERFALGMEMRGGRDAAELLRSTDAKGYVDGVADGMIKRYEQEYGAEKPTLFSSLFSTGGKQPRAMDQAFFQEAWHGSPHRFDKFSTAAIGTGEGAQAYGHGLYFAGDREVAEWYRNNLSIGSFEYRGKKITAKTKVYDKDPLTNRALASFAGYLFYETGFANTPDGALAAMDAYIQRNLDANNGREDAVSFQVETRRKMAQIAKDIRQGQLYKVELAPAEDEYLLWDKPLSEQSEKVREAIATSGLEIDGNWLGEGLYQTIKSKFRKESGIRGIKENQKAASDYLHSLGIRGIKYLDGSSRGKGDGNYNYVIFIDDDVSITGTFYQGPQGAMQQRGTNYFIRLFATSDLSTLLHESAHVFLAEIERVIESGTASESLQKDYATITAWAKSQTDRESTAWADTLSAAGGDELLAESSYRQELFARAFEAYLVDGKAPDVELEGAFNRFRRWLITVYQSVAGVIGSSGMQFELSPDITGVFDNLLRVQSDIDQAAGIYEMTAMSERDMDMFGVAKEDRAYMRRLVEQAKVKGESALHRARSKGKRALKQAWREQFTAEVKADPLQNLIVKLKAGGGLDLNAVRDLYGEDVAKKFPRNILWDGGALDLESISYEEGYANPRDMVDAILSWRAPEEIIREKMKAAEDEYDAQFTAEDFIVGTAEYADYLEIKHRYIARGVVGDPAGKNPKVIARQLFRKMAVDRVRSMPARDAMRVDLFLQAMRRANADERRAVMRGDWGEASKASERARLNYEYAMESANIKKLVADLEKRGKRLSAKGRKLKRGAKADIAQEYYLAISKLLARYGIAPPTVDIADAPTLETLLAQPDDTILSMGAVFSDWLVKENDSRPLKSLSAAEVEEITDLLKFLEGTGRLLINDRMFSAQVDLADLRQEVIANLETLKDRGVLPEKHWLRKLSDQKAKFLAETKIIMQLLRELDGYEYLNGKPGPLERLFYDKLEASRRQKLDLKKQWAGATKPALVQLRASAATFGKAENLAPSVPPPDWMVADGRTWDFETIVSVALNMGNEVNRQRVVDGYNLGQADLDTLTAKLTSADWQAVQQIGSAIGEFWPLLSGVYERMNFFTPGKVDPTPFTSPAGDELAGWYYPLQYDPISIKASQREEQNLVLNETQSAFLPSSVAKGSLKSRQESAGGMPPKLKLSVLNRHIEWAAQYISHAEIIADMNRLLTSPRSQDMRETLRRKLGDETYKAIVSIMRSIARPGGAEQPTVMESLAYRSMNMAAVYSMNLNTIGAVQQLTAIGNYAVVEGIAQGGGAVAGLATWANGAARFIANPSAALETMRRLSPVMGERIDDNLLKRLPYESSKDAIGDVAYGRGQAKSTIRLVHDISTRAATVLYAAFDSFISVPGWYGSYLDRLQRGADPQEAADQATKVFASYSPLPGEMDKTVLQNRRGLNIMFTFMSGWASKYYSHSSNMYRALKAGKIGPAQFMSHFVMERVLPVLVARALAQLVYGGGDDDDKSIAESALDFGIDLAVFSFTGIPLAKDIMNLVGNAVRSVVSGDKKKMTRNPFQLPSGMIIDLTAKTGGALYQLAEDFDDEKKQQKAIIALSEIMAFGLKVPNIGKRIDDTWEGIRQAQEEDDTVAQGVAHILLRPDPKKKER